MIIHAGLALAETQLEAIRAVVLAQEKQACGWLIIPDNLEQVLGWTKRTLQRHLNRGVQLGWWTIQKLANGQRLIRRVATHYIERKFALGHNFIKASIRKDEIGRIGLMRKRARQSTALTMQRMNEMRVHQEVERENKNVELRAEQFYIGECDVSRVRPFTSY